MCCHLISLCVSTQYLHISRPGFVHTLQSFDKFQKSGAQMAHVIFEKYLLPRVRFVHKLFPVQHHLPLRSTKTNLLPAYTSVLFAV